MIKIYTQASVVVYKGGGYLKIMMPGNVSTKYGTAVKMVRHGKFINSSSV